MSDRPTHSLDAKLQRSPVKVCSSGAHVDEVMSAVTLCVNPKFFSSVSNSDAKLKQFNQWQAQTARQEKMRAAEQSRAPITFAVHDAKKVMMMQSGETTMASGTSSSSSSSSILCHSFIHQDSLAQEQFLYDRTLLARVPEAAPEEVTLNDGNDDESAAIIPTNPVPNANAEEPHYWCLTAVAADAMDEKPQPRCIKVGEMCASSCVDSVGQWRCQPIESSSTLDRLTGRVLSVHPVSNVAWCAVDVTTTTFLIEAIGPLFFQHELSALVESVKAQLSPSGGDGAGGIVQTQILRARKSDDLGPLSDAYHVKRNECYVMSERSLQEVQTSTQRPPPSADVFRLHRDVLQRLNVKDNVARKQLNAVYTPTKIRKLFLELRTTIAALRHCISTAHVENNCCSHLRRDDGGVNESFSDFDDIFQSLLDDGDMEPGREGHLVNRFAPVTECIHRQQHSEDFV
jgi:hypothetical protein